jgi:hypothetical protein
MKNEKWAIMKALKLTHYNPPNFKGKSLKKMIPQHDE